jgi:hypothetical protein
MKTNYFREMNAVLADLERSGRIGESAPSLFLHSCCAPCSTAVIALLSGHFSITIFYYNPNIDERAEYEKRAEEQHRLLARIETTRPLSFVEGPYRPEEFLGQVEGLESEPEGGRRCTLCYALRVNRTAEEAAARGFEWFSTTLTVGPMKDALRINSLGAAAADRCGIRWLPSDFKKQGGFLRSIELSRRFGLYRQDYCGCSFSRSKRGPAPRAPA